MITWLRTWGGLLVGACGLLFGAGVTVGQVQIRGTDAKLEAHVGPYTAAQDQRIGRIESAADAARVAAEGARASSERAESAAEKAAQKAEATRALTEKYFGPPSPRK